MDDRGYESRFQDISRIVKNIVIQEDLANLANLAAIGGFRAPTVYVGYWSLLENWGLGHGIGSWVLQFDRVANDAGVIFSDYPLTEEEQVLQVVKPNSYASTLAFDVGIIGLALLVLFLLSFACSDARLKPKVSAAKWAIFSVACLYLVFMNLISLPMPWLALAYVHYINTHNAPQPRSGWLFKVLYYICSPQNTPPEQKSASGNHGGDSL